MTRERGGEPTKKPKKPLSPAAIRRNLMNARAQERSKILTDLRHHRDQCSACPHFKEDHEEQDGREVCTRCWDSRVRVHQFVSVYRAAKRYFARQDEEEAQARLDRRGSGVLNYGGTPAPPTTTDGGNRPMAITKTRRRVETDEDEQPRARVRREAPPRTVPPPRAKRTEEKPEPVATPKRSSSGQNDCLCEWDGRERQSCGGKTGSRFVPGHDAKLKSRLINAALDPKSTAKERARAEREIDKLGWTELLEKSRASRAEKASKPKAAPGERTEAQKAATERMRAANAAKSKAKVADDEDEEDDEDLDDEDEVEDDDEDESEEDDDEESDDDEEDDESDEDEEDDEEDEPEPPKAKAAAKRKR